MAIASSSMVLNSSVVRRWSFLHLKVIKLTCFLTDVLSYVVYGLFFSGAGVVCGLFAFAMDACPRLSLRFFGRL